MKKMLILLVGLLVAVVGCSKQGILLEDIEKHGTLLIGVSGDYPPFEFYKMIDGKEVLVGFDIMLGEKIAEELGVEVEFKNMDFNALVGALQARQVDMVISGMSPTEERMEQIDFTDIYYCGSSNVALIREDEVDKYSTVEDLKGTKIGTQLASIQTPIAESLTMNVKELQTTQSLLLELSNGNIDAVILGKDIADRYAQEFEGVIISSIVLENTEEGMAVGLPKGSDELITKINEIISDLKANGEIEKMFEEATQLANE